MSFPESADVYNDLAIGLALKNYSTVTLLDWPLKITPKGLSTCQNPSTGSEVMEICFAMSADMYSDLAIRLALKNYPKMTLHLPKSIHLFKTS